MPASLVPRLPVFVSSGHLIAELTPHDAPKHEQDDLQQDQPDDDADDQFHAAHDRKRHRVMPDTVALCSGSRAGTRHRNEEARNTRELISPTTRLSPTTDSGMRAFDKPVHSPIIFLCTPIRRPSPHSPARRVGPTVPAGWIAPRAWKCALRNSGGAAAT